MWNQIICNLGCKTIQYSLDLFYLLTFFFFLLQKCFSPLLLFFPLKETNWAGKFIKAIYWECTLTDHIKNVDLWNKGLFYHAHKLHASKKKKEGSEFFSDTLVSAKRSFALLIFCFSTSKALPRNPWLTKLTTEKTALYMMVYYLHQLKINLSQPILSFPGGSLVKNAPAMQEVWVPSLSLEDPLEKGMATHSSIPAWRIPWGEELGELQSMGSQVWTWLRTHVRTKFIY